MTSTFEFKELDKEGLENLEAISKANLFNKWMFDSINGYLNGRILEIGSGIGNISGILINSHKDVVLSDIRDSYCQHLSTSFPEVRIENIDLVHPNFEAKYAQFIGSFDCVFALNVVEHIENDNLALNNINKLLKENGKVIILVPAFQFLYNKLDKELYHYRRYTRKSLNTLLLQNNFNIFRSHYFNSMGIFGWFISGKLLGDKTITKSKMQFYNSLVPLFKLIDLFTNKWIGLSVISVGTKK